MLWSEVMAFMGIYRWHVESLNNIYYICHSAAIIASVLAQMMEQISGHILKERWDLLQGHAGYRVPYWQITECIISFVCQLLQRVISIDWKAIKYEDCDWNAMKYWCWSLSVCCLADFSHQAVQIWSTVNKKKKNTTEQIFIIIEAVCNSKPASW